jgi:hypothetical protein
LTASGVCMGRAIDDSEAPICELFLTYFQSSIWEIILPEYEASISKVLVREYKAPICDVNSV